MFAVCNYVLVFEQSIMHLIAALSCRGGGGGGGLGGILFSPKIFIFWEKCLFDYCLLYEETSIPLMLALMITLLDSSNQIMQGFRNYIVVTKNSPADDT